MIFLIIVLLSISLSAVPKKKIDYEHAPQKVREKLTHFLVHKSNNYRNILQLQYAIKKKARQDHRECPICTEDLATLKKNEEMRVMRHCCCQVLCASCYSILQRENTHCPLCRAHNCWG